jgi:hypothetical protein
VTGPAHHSLRKYPKKTSIRSDYITKLLVMYE